MHIYIYIYIYNHENNVPSRLSPQHNGFVATQALDHMMYGFTLLVPMNQRVPNLTSKEHNISSHKWSTTHRVLNSYRGKKGVTYMQSWKQCLCGDNREGTSFSLLHIYYAYFVSVRFEYSVDHLWPLTLCSLLSLLSTIWFVCSSNV